MSLLRINAVHAATAAGALASAHSCGAVGCARTDGVTRQVHFSSADTGESYPMLIGSGYRLFAWPLPEFDEDGSDTHVWAVVCHTHYDELRRDARKAAASAAAQLHDDTQDSLF